MTQASIAKTAEFTALNELESGEEIEEISANDSTTGGTSGKKMGAKKVGYEKSSSAESKESSSSSRRMVKMTDLKSLESKLVGEMNTRFESLDGKFAGLFEVLDSDKTDPVQRRSNPHKSMDSGTLGARRPPTETLANPDTAREEMAIDNMQPWLWDGKAWLSRQSVSFITSTWADRVPEYCAARFWWFRKDLSDGWNGNWDQS